MPRAPKDTNDNRVWVNVRIDRTLLETLRGVMARTVSTRTEVFEAALNLLLEHTGKGVLESSEGIALLREIAASVWTMAYQNKNGSRPTIPAHRLSKAPETPRAVKEIREVAAVKPEEVKALPVGPTLRPTSPKDRIDAALRRRQERLAAKEALSPSRSAPVTSDTPPAGQ